MSPGAVLLVLAGVWLAAQVLGGGLLDVVLRRVVS